MIGRHEELQAVRRRDDAPVAFCWRGRHYGVRSVLEHWTVAGRWWEAPGLGGLFGLDVPAGEISGVIDDRERDCWRVEAVSRAGTVGALFDLSFSWVDGRWSLDRVFD